VPLEKLNAKVSIKQQSTRFKYGFKTVMAVNTARIILNPINQYGTVAAKGHQRTNDNNE